MSDSEEESPDRQLKIVLLGDSNVGKSCIANRYCTNNFSKQYIPTPGVEFLLKRDVVNQTKNVTIHLWDVGGESRNMLDKYIFNANMVLIVFDVTNEVAFLNVIKWVKTVREVCSGHGNPPMLALVGNKTDMEHQRVVKMERQNKLANELRVTSHFCSARTGEGVSLIFQRIIAEFLGLRLTRSQAEGLQRVVKAEISTHSSLVPAVSQKVHSHSSSSSVCVIQ